jgi:hypothetical protein
VLLRFEEVGLELREVVGEGFEFVGECDELLLEFGVFFLKGFEIGLFVRCLLLHFEEVCQRLFPVFLYLFL